MLILIKRESNAPVNPYFLISGYIDDSSREGGIIRIVHESSERGLYAWIGDPICAPELREVIPMTLISISVGVKSMDGRSRVRARYIKRSNGGTEQEN